MKIAVIKLGARITWETDAAVGPGEAISICKALTKGGAEVHVYTKILPKDTLDPSITWHNILEDHMTTGAMDALVVINGNVNFFGGAEDTAQILNYKLLNNFHGRVFYVMCDPELPLLQIWPSVQKKPWGAKYTEAELNITRTDIVLLSQPTDLHKIAFRWNKKTNIALGGIQHFPFERFPLLNEMMEPTKEPLIDLMYGGTTRGGRRVPNLFKWYWNHPDDIRVEVFGKIDRDDFIRHSTLTEDKPPKFSGMVKYCDVLPKMNTALAHLVTGDPLYEQINIIPQRTYECLAAGNVVFVDASMDTNRRIWNDSNPEVQQFLYVKTRQELTDRIRALKADHDLRMYMLVEQFALTKFDATDFCKSLVKTLET